jgi:hypothetical protein
MKTEVAKKQSESLVKLPTLTDLISESEESIKENGLMVLLNQPPPKTWIAKHPTLNTEYLPINRVEYLLNRIFTKWWVEIRNVVVIANSLVVTVRVYVINPVTGKEEWQDGVGAAPIQTEKGAGAMDWNKAKSAGVQMAAPSAESYAIKDACEKWGKLFGKDLNRKEEISYDSLLKSQPVLFEDLKSLYDVKKDSLTGDQKKDADRILNNKETASYKKLYDFLKKL